MHFDLASIMFEENTARLVLMTDKLLRPASVYPGKLTHDSLTLCFRLAVLLVPTLETRRHFSGPPWKKDFLSCFPEMAMMEELVYFASSRLCLFVGKPNGEPCSSWVVSLQSGFAFPLGSQAEDGILGFLHIIF